MSAHLFKGAGMCAMRILMSRLCTNMCAMIENLSKLEGRGMAAIHVNHDGHLW